MFGVLTLVSSVYVLSVVPEFLVRFSLWLLTHTVYRIRIVGQDHVPSRGPALLVCNHLSHVDGFLVGSCVQRFVRFLVYRPYFEHWAFNRLLTFMKAIPVGVRPRRAGVARTGARRNSRHGHVVCIFAEGSISRTGNMLPFKRGFERIVDGLDVPVIPGLPRSRVGQHLQLQGRPFLLEVAGARAVSGDGRVRRAAAVDARARAEARLALQTLGCELAHRIGGRPDESLGRQFVRTAKHQLAAFALADAIDASR